MKINGQKLNKRMLSDWFSAALQTSRKCGRYEYKGSEEWQALTGTQTVEPRKKPHQEYLASCAKIRKEITSLEYTTLISPLRTMSSVTTICRSLLLRTRWPLFIGSKIIMSSIIVPKSWDWSENERRGDEYSKDS